MSAAAITAILAILQTAISATPAALQLFASIKALLSGGSDPTAQQWSDLLAQMAAVHAEVQAAAQATVASVAPAPQVLTQGTSASA